MPTRPLVVFLAGALLLAACGKTGPSSRLEGSPYIAGTYHLEGAAQATNLEVRNNGTFTLRTDSCDSSGVVACGDWNIDSNGPPHVLAPEGVYWPTPATFPSTDLRELRLGVAGERDLVVVGTSTWAGEFTQRWSRGRTCSVCGEHTLRTQRPCKEPMPACLRVSARRSPG